MKIKHLVIALAAALAVAGIWTAQQVSRARRQLVSLDVHEMPLREVLRKIEWQTWKKIRAEENLDARITLHVVDQPLATVLDKIAMQAGARWTTLYAVYDSANALKELDGALRRDGKIDNVGWTRLAPNDHTTDEAELPGENAGFKGDSELGGPRKFVTGPPPGALASPDGPPGSPPQNGGFGGPMMVRKSPGSSMVIMNNNGQVESWSPTELVMQSTLTNRLKGELFHSARAEEADAAALKTNGKRATIFAFRKSIMGIGSPALAGPESGPPARNSRFANLTPEQRVERARSRQDHRPQFIQKN